MDKGPPVIRAQDELFSRRKEPGKAICKQHHEMRHLWKHAPVNKKYQDKNDALAEWEMAHG